MALSHAILSALENNICSGYDLAKRFDNSVGFFWQASHQQIYRELIKLEEQGLISAETVHQSGRPDKKVYSITEYGQGYLRDWIAQPSDIAPLKDELLVKIFAGHLVSKKTIIAELQQHRSQHLERLSQYKDIQQRSFPNPQTLSAKEKFSYLTLRMGIRYETEWLAWCDEVIEFLTITHQYH